MTQRWGIVLTRVLGAALLGLGLVRSADRLMWWSACSDSLVVDVTDRLPYTTQCLDAMSAASIDDSLPIWAAGLLLSVAATAAVWTLGRRVRRSALAAVAVIAVVNPLIDPGFFWQGWVTADSMPGLGILPAIAIVLAGAILLQTTPVPSPQTGTTVVVKKDATAAV
ncbi:hypothetical protein [Microbacterium sp. SLBN-146]|uniref:hypothetical protein n=1 Tax=Microbacterium sp. SLBN-146 TaxID=2768457 RepID=UPI00114D91D7|nr:hypothetical protein [Microbacterium sp. SLBN-146]TQJ30830.1 hypothetical protein FBY39_1287 [Microbacterium sp. SLBN-146]